MTREMKDSGITSIGLIPIDWEVSCFKYNYSFGKGLPITKADLVETGLGVISYGQIHSKKNRGVDVRNDLIRFVDRSYKVQYPQCRLHQYDFVFADTSEDLDGCGNCVYMRADIELFAGYHSLVVRPIARRDNRYMAYLFLTDEWRQQLRNSVSGIKVFSITKGIMEKTRILIPSLTEQKRIADYLDIICNEIYDSMADVQAQIEILEQYKRSVITEAVTKGLNPNVPLKDSGAAWIDTMPSHWALIPAKYMFHNSDLRRIRDDVLLTSSQKHGIISQTDYMERENAKIVLANKDIEDWKHVEPNDFIISLRSFQGGLEMSEITGCITWHYVVLKASRTIVPKYYKWLFKSQSYITALQRTCNFIRDGQDLRFSNFSQVPLPEPPIEEQQAIASYLDTKCAEIGAIIDGKRQQLSTLEEYKKSVIFEYVTGKKEVPVA